MYYPKNKEVHTMLINYHVTGSDRKRLVAAIAEHTG